ncbi:MAG: prolyl oligopeptidase family serine peptidase, partial [Planctomycetales bacterium]|nr:prolyl oligopeptidase family serine peptidase [Planctomycetales bacterium]
VLFTAIALGAWPAVPSHAQAPQPLSVEQRQALDQGLQTLEKSLVALRDQPAGDIADAGIFLKGLAWGLKYDPEFTPADITLMQKAVARGEQRAKALADGKRSWTARRGKLALGYVSRVDGSVQPYGIIVPAKYDSTQPTRLDVVLHGSTRPVGLSELKFIARFDEGDEAAASPPDQPFIELHPLGRVENCYRWAGETDVFEAIEDVCRRYHIDRDRIVLRGMSMGASGTWHLGLKHPDRFVALGPYCGYVDTHRFSETPLGNFVKIGPLPAHQELGLHMLDSIDYAANAGVVPAVACMGEKDVFFQAHVLMGNAMQREGLTMVNLISPGTGHVIDPVTHAEQMRRIGEHVAIGLNHTPRELRFVTWTLKYSRCHWLQVLGLERHYARAELSARFGDGIVEVAEPKNITRFAILTSALPAVPKKIRVGTTEIVVPDSITAKSSGLVVSRRGDAWRIDGDFSQVALPGKRPGLQGPIDDAFTTPFLCVRGTGQPWNAAVQAYADASLQRFAHEWHHYFRGELPVKDDSAVTDEDVRTRNLILFGDPGSNTWIAKVLPHLPLTWSKENLRLAGEDFSAADHVPALIAANPLPGAASRYVVLNSGHTFREAELAKLNYLLFPRWGDWAVLQIDPSRLPTAPVDEKIVRAGYFDEQWQLPLAD